eukprot:scaffold61189_cov42-Prasinocladus_malaysianus.AAC.2
MNLPQQGTDVILRVVMYRGFGRADCVPDEDDSDRNVDHWHPKVASINHPVDVIMQCVPIEQHASDWDCKGLEICRDRK